MCKYSDDTDYECPHKKLEDSDYCIFHLQDDNKDIDEFNKGMKEILETEEDSISLHGFYFPSESSDFTGQKFKKKIIFRNAKFSGRADFEGAKFRYADFNKTKFSEGANFGEVTFSVFADFRNTIFSGNATFLGAKFSEAWFVSAKFKEADFGGAKFSECTYFTDATFSEKASFYYAKFLNELSFVRTIFSEVDFESAKFLGETVFLDTVFSEVCFRHAKLIGTFKFNPIKSGVISFKYTQFSDNVRIKADLSKCSFANSNIERVDMTDSTWIVDNKPKNLHSSLIEWFKYKMGFAGTSIKIWEECQGKLSSNWRELEGIYRRLKQSYQKFGDNSKAGKFYYQEMECKRKQSSGSKHCWDVLYNELCGYGEEPINVILYSGLIIFAASVFFFYWGIELHEIKALDLTPRLINYDLNDNIQWVATNYLKVISDWSECLYTSVITFTTLGYGDVHPIGYSRVVASIEAGLGICLTALFIFVFTRKMVR